MRDGCPFCDYAGPSEVIGNRTASDDGVLLRQYVIEPMNPVTPGHVLVIPEDHVVDFRDEGWEDEIRETFAYAAEWAAHEHPREGCNIIASAGVEATQTVMHFHVHVVPRRAGDGLKLPWSA